MRSRRVPTSARRNESGRRSGVEGRVEGIVHRSMLESRLVQWRRRMHLAMTWSAVSVVRMLAPNPSMGHLMV